MITLYKATKPDRDIAPAKDVTRKMACQRISIRQHELHTQLLYSISSLITARVLLCGSYWPDPIQIVKHLPILFAPLFVLV